MCCVRGQRKAQKSLSSGVSSLRKVVGHQNDHPGEAAGACYEEMEGLDQDEESIDSKMEAAQEEWRKPRVSSKAQNWCDLFFILDILASRCLPMIFTDQFGFSFHGSMDPCHVLVFLGRIDSHLDDLAQTEVLSPFFTKTLSTKSVG